MNFAVLIIAAAALALGATAASGEDQIAAAPPTVAAPAGHIPPPKAGKSQVVFFRTGAYMGAATWFKIRENGVELGKMSNQAYFVVTLDPGPHTFTATTENKTKLKLELDDGETYYVRGTLQMGILMAEPSLAPADLAMFEDHYSHMHLAKTPDAAKASEAAAPKS